MYVGWREDTFRMYRESLGGNSVLVCLLEKSADHCMSGGARWTPRLYTRHIHGHRLLTGLCHATGM